MLKSCIAASIGAAADVNSLYYIWSHLLSKKLVRTENLLGDGNKNSNRIVCSKKYYVEIITQKIEQFMKNELPI